MSSHLFCKGCASFFELIDPMSRCPYCFRENDGKRPCPECIRKKRWGLKMGAALDYVGPVMTLVKKLKYGKIPYLAKTASAFMTAQFFQLEWPIPDVIIPVPRRHWFLGVNHAALLAKKLANSLSTTSVELIKRRVGDLSQARLSKEQREALAVTSFYLKKETYLNEKSVLIVDDVITTGTTMHRCIEVISGAFPKKIYALSLARSIYE